MERRKPANNMSCEDATAAFSPHQFNGDASEANIQHFIHQRDTAICEVDDLSRELARNDRLLLLTEQENNDLAARLNTSLEETDLMKNKFHELEGEYGQNLEAIRKLESQLADKEAKMRQSLDEKRDLIEGKRELVSVVREMFEACKDATDELHKSNEVAGYYHEQNISLTDRLKHALEEVHFLKEQHTSLNMAQIDMKNEVRAVYDHHHTLEAVLGRNEEFVRSIERKMEDYIQVSNERNRSLENANWETAMLLEKEIGIKQELDAINQALQAKVEQSEEEKLRFQRTIEELENSVEDFKKSIKSLSNNNERLTNRLNEAEKKGNALETELRYLQTFTEMERENYDSTNSLLNEKIEECKTLEKVIQTKEEEIKNMEAARKRTSALLAKTQTEKNIAVVKNTEKESFFAAFKVERETLVNDKDEALKKLKCTEEEMSKKNNEMHKLRTLLDEQKNMLIKLETERNEYYEGLEKSDGKLEISDKRATSLLEELKITNDRLLEAEKENSGLSVTVKMLEQQKNDVDSQKNTARQEVEKLHAKNDSQQGKIRHLENMLSQRGAEITSLERRNQELVENTKHLRQEIENRDKDTVQNFKELSVKHKEEELDMLMKCNANETKVSSLLRRQEETEAMVRKLERENSELLEIQPKLVKCNEIIASQKETENSLRNKIDSMQQAMKDADTRIKRAAKQKAKAEREKFQVETQLKSYEDKMKDKEAEYLLSANQIVREFQDAVFNPEVMR